MRQAVKSAVALTLGAVLLLGGCAREGEDYADVTEDIVDSFPIRAEPAGENPQLAPASELYAVFHTTAGDITVMLYPDESPEEVERFVRQARAGEYDGQQFVYVRRNGLIECDRPARETGESASSEAAQAGGESEAYTGEEPAAAAPQLPEEVQGAAYSDRLHHYYGAVGISRENDEGGDRLHFVVETTVPEDERLVPTTLYMRRLLNRRMAQLNALAQQAPLTDLQLAAFEARLNEEVQALSDGVIPEEYAQLYAPVNETYMRVGGQWGLDYQYPVIGHIVDGQNVADAISQAKVSAATRRPKQDIVIEYVEIVEK